MSELTDEQVEVIYAAYDETNGAYAVSIEGKRAIVTPIVNTIARLAAPPPDAVECFECGGGGTVTGIGADPLPSGEPGEPYQTQETCSVCVGTGSVAAPPPDEREGLRAEVARLWAMLGYEYPNPALVRDAEPAPSDETCAACGRLYADEAELYCGWCGAKAGDAEQPAREEQP